jgi:predicted Zn-dependent protease
MKPTLRLSLLIAVAALAACTDIGTPSRPVPYESRLFIPFDSLGQPAVDSLRFHWPKASLPVRYWVEDSVEAPALVRAAITDWKEAFLYREWDAALVTDSGSADVIVRIMTPPPKPSPSTIRLASLRPECEGATDVDTVATREEFLVPVRVFLNPKFQSDSLDLCMRITATHEVGHTMGLLQHSGDINDLMFTDPQATRLSARDVATVEALYHREADMHPVRP